MSAALESAVLVAEAHVLGAVLLDQAVLDRAAAVLDPQDFGDARHRLIYGAALTLVERREPVDVVTLQTQLADDGRLELAGGWDYLVQLCEGVSTAANADAWVDQVRRAGRLRRTRAAALALVERVDAMGLGDADQVADVAAAAFSTLAPPASSQTSTHRRAVLELVEDLKRLYEHPEETQAGGIQTGLTDLDAALVCLGYGDLILLGARPGMGKTAFAYHLAMAASKAGKRGVYFTTEVRAKKLAARGLGSDAGVNTRAFRTGRITDTEIARVVSVVHQVREWGDRLVIEPVNGPTPAVLRRALRRHASEGPLDYVVVDHLHQCRPSAPKKTDEAEMADIVGHQRELATELHVSWLACSQLNRQVEARPNKRPQVSDLRGSGAIEQDAHTILLLYRDEHYNPDTEAKGVAEIIVGKAREGAPPLVRVRFDAPTQRFSDMPREGTWA